MKTQELEVVKNAKQTIRLVDGEFTPSEASFVISSLLDEKINFHKLQRLTMLEGNCNSKTDYDNGRIDELESEKLIMREFISKMREQGMKLQINGKLEITIAEQ